MPAFKLAFLSSAFKYLSLDYMKYHNLIIYMACICPTGLYAAPEDLFLQAQSLAKETKSSLKFTTELNAVNDRIDFLDIRQSEGVQNSNAGDYMGAHFAMEYQFHPQWIVDGSYWYREIDYAQDTNTIHSGSLGIRYFPELNLNKKDRFFIAATLWGNQANELNKSTATIVNQQRLEQLQVNQPQDLQFQLNGVFSRKLDPMNQINLFAGVGYSQVKVDSLDIQAKYQGCLMDININSSNQYSGKLNKPCSIDNLLINQLNISGNASDYGIEIQNDLNYNAYFTSLGGSWNWRYRQFESQIAYQYQHLWRDNIDDRVRNFGNTPVNNNHSLGLKLSYDVTPKISTFMKGEFYQHNFVGNIPFLYNGVTASRLDRRYGLATLGLTFQGF